MRARVALWCAGAPLARCSAPPPGVPPSIGRGRAGGAGAHTRLLRRSFQDRMAVSDEALEVVFKASLSGRSGIDGWGRVSENVCLNARGNGVPLRNQTGCEPAHVFQIVIWTNHLHVLHISLSAPFQQKYTIRTATGSRWRGGAGLLVTAMAQHGGRRYQGPLLGLTLRS